ncbi:MAG: hypothetical protein KGL39_41080 [Patescibacteria group bacterium]|nr:hypothetical protein [Patescibacteria group bacterium]
MNIGTRTIKGCKPSTRYQRYFNKTNKLYFEGKLPVAKVLTAPLLNITQLSQSEVEDKRQNNDWKDAGEYGLLATNEDEEDCIILDRGTAVFHPILTKQTVLHEQIHLKLRPYIGHGAKFKKEVRRIAALGALDDLI